MKLPPMTTDTRPYIGPARKWSHNSSPAQAHDALIETPEGEHVPGVRIIEPSGTWFLLTEANAVQLAMEVLAAVDAGRKHQ